jgi:hypothetical protein
MPQCTPPSTTIKGKKRICEVFFFAVVLGSLIQSLKSSEIIGLKLPGVPPMSSVFSVPTVKGSETRLEGNMME